MKPQIFVDGQEGTTGLRIHDYLAQRPDLTVLLIDPDKRKDPAERKKLLDAADLVFLCLPDAASREAVALIENPRTRVIDASTAFRTHPGWVYGLPELDRGQRDALRAAVRVANPGCHAAAFILSVFPLLRAGLLRADATLAAFSLTGYSGAGKKMIAAYESPPTAAPLAARGPRPYALALHHKHLPEMVHVTGLRHAPLFTPVICNVHSGLAVTTLIGREHLTRPVTLADLHACLSEHYAGEPFIRMMPLDPAASLDNGYLDITGCNNTNRADLFVCGHSEDSADPQFALIARLDNLGKGASGAAVQCMNLMLGLDESTGLTVAENFAGRS